MPHFDNDEPIEHKIKKLIKKLGNYYVDSFCETVSEIAKESGNATPSSLASLSIRLKKRGGNLKIGQLEYGSLFDVMLILTFLIEPRTTKNPPKTITYTTPRKFLKKIKLK